MADKQVRNAFQVLVDHLRKSQKMINQQGKAAFEKGDYPQAERISERGQRIQRMTEQVKGLQKEWEVVFPEETEKGEAKQLEPLNLSKDKVASYYREYSKNLEEAQDYAWRKEKYRQIPDVLDKLVEADNQAEFFEIYEQLVGKQGQKSLWHSGSLYRQKGKVVTEYEMFQEMVRNMRVHPEYTAAELFESGQTYTRQIPGLAVNVMTEVMHSYYMDRCPVLNSNSLSSMKFLIDDSFPSGSNSFNASEYQRFADTYQELCDLMKMENFGHVDHFLNYLYWRYVKKD